MAGRARSTAAVAALRAGDVDACGRAVTVAYGLDPDAPEAAALTAWWRAGLPGGR